MGYVFAKQKTAYEMVLAAQAAALDVSRPGGHWNAPHEAALRIIAQGLIDLKLCSGSLDAVLESESYKRFYMHRTGHWLGMDVHDVGDYKQQGEWRGHLPGPTYTVGAGCFIPPADDVPPGLWNIGIPHKDKALIPATGGAEGSILSRHHNGISGRPIRTGDPGISAPRLSSG